MHLPACSRTTPTSRRACWRCYAVTGDPAWLRLAGELLDVVLDRFPDAAGGFFDTADDRADPRLAAMRRPQDPTDNATPSGQAAAAGALLTYAAYTGSPRHREAAERALAVYAPLAAGHARFAGWGLAVAEALADGPREVAVVGPAADPATVRLHRVALLGTAPGAAVAVGGPGRATGHTAAGRPAPGRGPSRGLRLPPFRLRGTHHRHRRPRRRFASRSAVRPERVSGSAAAHDVSTQAAAASTSRQCRGARRDVVGLQDRSDLRWVRRRGPATTTRPAAAATTSPGDARPSGGGRRTRRG